MILQKNSGKGKIEKYQYNEMQRKIQNKKFEKAKYLGEWIGGAVWLHATRGRNRILLAQRGDSSNKLLQVLHRKITGESVGVIGTRIRPKGIFASLKRLHSNPKEIGSDLDTR
jgi:hypothetical protein